MADIDFTVTSSDLVLELDTTDEAFNLGGATSSGVQSVVAGTNVTVDATDSQNPIVSSSASGGGSSDSSVFTFDTSATPAGNLYADWSTMMAAVGAVDGAKIIYIAGDGSQNAEAGTWNMTDVTLIGLANKNDGVQSKLNFPDGTILTNWNGKLNDIWLTTDNDTDYFVDSTAFSLFFQLENSTLDNTGSVPMIRYNNGSGFIFLLLGNASTLRDDVASIFELVDGTLQCYIYGNVADFQSDTVIGAAGSIILGIGSIALQGNIPTFPFFSGTVTPYYFTKSELLGYDNSLSDLVATNVQAAIDELTVSGRVWHVSALINDQTPLTDALWALPPVGFHVILKNQTNPAENGLYITDGTTTIAKDANYIDGPAQATLIFVFLIYDNFSDASSNTNPHVGRTLVIPPLLTISNMSLSGNAVKTLAENIEYSNGNSGLTADDVQEAIDELEDNAHYEEAFVAQTTLNVAHNLGKYPAVQVMDSANDQCEGTIHHTDINNLVATFSSAFTGTITCN